MPDSIISQHPDEHDYATLYRLLVHDLADFAIFMMDPEGRLTTWNAGVERNLGYTQAEFIGRHVSMLFTPQDLANRMPDRELATAKSAGHAPDERWHVRKDGTAIFVEGVVTALFDSSHTLIGFEKIMRDATKRKKAEEDLTRSHEELSAFSHIVAHDLRAPLRTVGINTERLIRRCEPLADQESRNLAERIRADLASMDDLIHDLLRLSEVSLDTGPEPVGVSLETALARAEANQQSAMQQSCAQITHDALPVVRGNPSHFIELFQNLIGNSLKYRSQRPPCVHVSAQKRDAEWEISVSDNGIGIEPKYVDRIFQSFTRLHGRELPGTGLGLAICKRIVERYGGRIWVESDPGRGSTFRFTIPISRGAPPPAEG